MDLFNPSAIEQLLPFDGEAYYHGKVLNTAESQYYYQRLLEDIPWKNDEAIVFGKHYITKRKVAWFGDTNFKYTYSGVTKQAHLWTPDLVALKELVTQLSGQTYNSCLLNLYHSGEEGMAWHSDGEKTLLDNGAIASMTLGAERKFSFKHKNTQQRIDILLEHGSLLVMQGEIQKHWLHRLPPTKKVQSPRINLTFRTIVL